MKKTRLCDLLGIEYPIIQAPMDWITDATLAAAVSNAGGLGVIGPNAGARKVTPSVTETGERLRRQIRKARELTGKPFGVNLVAMKADDFPEGGKAFSDRCCEVVIEEGVPVVVFVGNAPEVYTAGLKAAGITVLHRALPASVAAAREAEAAGVDAFVAVGFEAGGHTGAECLTTATLVPRVADALRIPVVAGGGIGDGRGIVAALAWGAEGVYLGSRFLATSESGAHENVKQAVVRATEMDSVAFPGVLGMHRALRTPLAQRCLDLVAAGASPAEVTEVYHSGYEKGMLEGDTENGSLVCGTACAFVERVQGAAEVVRQLVAETDRVLARLA
jgi:enoyl-[acyl-carrier protein] reductase II